MRAKGAGQELLVVGELSQQQGSTIKGPSQGSGDGSVRIAKAILILHNPANLFQSQSFGYHRDLTDHPTTPSYSTTSITGKALRYSTMKD